MGLVIAVQKAMWNLHLQSRYSSAVEYNQLTREELEQRGESFRPADLRFFSFHFI